MIRTAKIRALTTCFVMLAVFSSFSARLIYLQVMKSDKYTAIANQNQIYKRNIPAQRGSIRDIHGEILANDLPLCRVIVDASRFKPGSVPGVAHLLADVLELDEKALTDRLAEYQKDERRYLVIKTKVPIQTGDDLKTAIAERNRELFAQIKQVSDEQNKKATYDPSRKTADDETKKKLGDQVVRGIYFEPDSTRIYPNSSMLCHVIGFTDFTGQGVQGVEKSMDAYLQGHDGYRYITHDRTGAELVQHRGIEQTPKNGYNVHLTIDMGLQAIVEKELDAAIKKYTPEKATIILMRPKTGEIVAMASRPHFDINERATAEPEQMKNRAIIDMIEPGSTFKIVTVSGVLNEKLVGPNTPVYCENGHWEYCGKILHDAHPIGTIPTLDVLVHSSNIGAAKLAMQLGENRLYSYIKAMGFGDRTGIDLPGEIVGMVHPVSHWSKISITRIPMGQGVGVTPIQMVMAMGAVANGGKLMMPHVIHSITNEQDESVTEFAPVMVRQIASPEVMKEVVQGLTDVVSARGTAKGAAVPGFAVAGKTGTAQKVSPQGGYMSGKYVVSFLGFLPANDPELVGMVMIDNAVTAPGMNYGGLVSAPIFSTIAEQAMRYLNIEPTLPIVQNSTGSKPVALAGERD